MNYIRIVKIKYPLKPSDFEVQAELYWFLKNKGFNVRGEITVKGNRKKNIRGARFDLVIFATNKLPLAIIEAKNSNREEINVPLVPYIVR